jgi:hypothetical protein
LPNLVTLSAAHEMKVNGLMSHHRSLFPTSFGRLPSIFSRDFDDFPKLKDDQIIKVGKSMYHY